MEKEREWQRWTAKRKVELLLQLIKDEQTLVDVCREHDLQQSEVEVWMETFVTAGERGLKARSEDEQAAHEREVRSASGCRIAGSDRDRAGSARSPSVRVVTPEPSSSSVRFMRYLAADSM
jgi:hypothetical protein